MPKDVAEKIGAVPGDYLVFKAKKAECYHMLNWKEMDNTCSLTSDTVVSGTQTSIAITLQSNDAKNAHSIKMEFSSHLLVSFLIGSRELEKTGTIWHYEETLESKATHTTVINVLPTLESGVSKITYRITIVIYRDGEQFFNKNLDLVVQL